MDNSPADLATSDPDAPDPGIADPGIADPGVADPGIADNVDWGLAASVGRRIARPGPRITRYTADAARAELLDASVRAEGPVRDVTGLADGLAVPTARVLDRSGWIEAAATSMPAMLSALPDPAVTDPAATDPAATDPGATGFDGTGTGSDTGDREPAQRGGGLGAKMAGAQAGGLLAFLSSAILGQYDPFSADPETGDPGVLMLVMPNIIAVERQLRVDPSDFRLWVCLHEVTHRVQFSANPWLADYMRSNVGVLTDADDDSVAAMVTRITEGLRGGRPREKGVIGLMQLLQSPEQYAAFERVLVLGTLLEGHADHVMDAVGPAHVPTVATIREAFDRRRSAPRNPVQRLLRALIGMDAKMAQYVRGKAFVDHVVDAVGMPAFNTVWTSPETMPLMSEIDQPDRWIERVL
ncbi:zinc-dependent metalloprotease [Gordonia shandongensis]|uniref:zinc-dependent metalloprotease n=1 Tax=Gordonia shandongensis TaxID=376351 RepID=UPI0003F9802F|nr:zinc-dependent metalloprotease [Gordonia shandongensis]